MAKKPVIKIGKYTISEDSPCFVIVEIGHNHQGEIEIAKKMIDAVAGAGAQAVKFQKRSNKALYTKEMYNMRYDHENSFGKTYGEHREYLEFSEKQYRILKKYAEKKGLIFFATAFDMQSVDFLERIGVPAYKLASALVTDTPLIEYIAKKGKPIFMSTGTSTLEEIDRAYDIIKKYKVPLCILQCTAVYPMFDYTEADLCVIKNYKRRYPDAIIGYSGHESGIVLPVVAYILGARVVEKHFTLNRAMKGSDHHYSLEPQGLTKLMRDLDRVYKSLGSELKRVYLSEFEAKKKMGKSIVAKKNIKKGTVITPELLAFKSPGTGLPPYLAERLLGKVALSDIAEDTILELKHLSKTAAKGFKIKKPIDWGSYK